MLVLQAIRALFCPAKSGRATFSSVWGVPPFLAHQLSGQVESHIPLSLGQPGVLTSQAAHASGVPPVHIGTQSEGAPAIGAFMNINAASATASTTAVITVPSNTAIGASLVCYPLTSHIVTPIRTSVLAHYLSSHPDIGLVTYLTHGFQHGFDLMFAGPITFFLSINILHKHWKL